MGFDTVKYGEILYRDSEEFKQREERRRKLNWNLFRIVTVIFVIGSVVNFQSDRTFSFLLGICAAIFLTMGYTAFIDTGSDFILYETGIRFRNEKIPFIPYSHVDHIELRVGSKWKTPYLVMVTASGTKFYIASKIMKHVPVVPEDYHTMLDVLKRRLKENQPDENEIRLIRDVNGVQWDVDANRELKKYIFSSSLLRLSINEHVLSQGRNRVHLTDVQNYLKK